MEVSGHIDRNFRNYENWNVILNLILWGVVVKDNSPYHNVQVSPAPTSNSTKIDDIVVKGIKNSIPRRKVKPGYT
jgi:hypothetical protein